jgi:hypothetical protein
LIYKCLPFFFIGSNPLKESGVKASKLNVFSSVTKEKRKNDTSSLKGEKHTQLRAKPILDTGWFMAL